MLSNKTCGKSIQYNSWAKQEYSNGRESWDEQGLFIFKDLLHKINHLTLY